MPSEVPEEGMGEGEGKLVRCLFCPEWMGEAELSRHLRDYHRISLNVAPSRTYDRATQTEGHIRERRRKGDKRKRSKRPAPALVTSTPKKTQHDWNTDGLLPSPSTHDTLEEGEDLECTYIEEGINIKLESEAEPEDSHVEQPQAPAKPRKRAVKRQRRIKSKTKSKYKNLESGTCLVYSFVDAGEESILDRSPNRSANSSTSSVDCPQINYTSVRKKHPNPISGTDPNRKKRPTGKGRVSKRKRELGNLRDSLHNLFLLPTSRHRKRSTTHRMLDKSKYKRKSLQLSKLIERKQRLKTHRCKADYSNTDNLTQAAQSPIYKGIPTISFYSKKVKSTSHNSTQKDSSKPILRRRSKELSGLQDYLSSFYVPNSTHRLSNKKRNKFRVLCDRSQKVENKSDVTTEKKAQTKKVFEKKKALMSPIYKIVNMEVVEDLRTLPNISSKSSSRNIEAHTYRYSDNMRRKIRRKLINQALATSFAQKADKERDLNAAEKPDITGPRRKSLDQATPSKVMKCGRGESFEPPCTLFTCSWCVKNFKCSRRREIKEEQDQNRPEPARAMEVTKDSFNCDQCGKTFSTKGSLRTHMYNHTKKGQRRTLTKRRYKCDLCENKYITMGSLKTHKWNHTKKNQELEEESSINNDVDSKYIDFIFEEPASPNQEVNAAPSLDIGVRYRCPLCDNSFREEEDVKKHIDNQHRAATTLQPVRQELRVGLERGEGGRRSARDMDSGQEGGDGSEIEAMFRVGEGRRRTQSSRSLQEAGALSNVIISPNFTSPPEADRSEGLEGIKGQVKTGEQPKVVLSPRSSRQVEDPATPQVPFILTSELKIEPMAVQHLSMALETPSTSRASSRGCLTPLPLITGTMREVGEERRRQIRSIVRGLEEEGTADFNIF